MFFMNENVKIPPAKTSTYATWADKNGYKYYTLDHGFTEAENTNGKDNLGVSSTCSFGIDPCYGHGLEETSREASECGTQPKRRTRRSTRTEDGSVQEEPKPKKSKGRSTRRSSNSDKDGS